MPSVNTDSATRKAAEMWGVRIRRRRGGHPVRV